MNKNAYRKLMLMLGVSFLIMYTVMFLNVDKAEHVHLSMSRLYMTVLMVAPMALLMLILMGGMFPNKRKNTLISVLAITLFVLALTFLRNQVLVTDEQYMKAMIPHHSSAVLVSKKAKLKDPELRTLAESIIQSQEKEIAEMDRILKKLEKQNY